MKRAHIAIFVLVALVSSIGMGVFTGTVDDTFENQFQADYGRGEGSIATAVTLLEEGTFGTKEHPFFGLLPRGPVYPLLLAVSFALFGKSLVTIWVLNFVLFSASLIFLYAIVRRFLDGVWAMVPPLLLALYWGASLYVFVVNTEMLTFFLITAFVLLIFKYLDTQRLEWLAVHGIITAVLILVKPVLLFFYPFVVALLAYQLWRRVPRLQLLIHLLVFVTLVSALVGSWQWRQYRVLGSTELGAGGHLFLIRSLSDEFEGDALKGFIVSAFLGDFITDKFIPGFLNAPEPQTSSRTLGPRWRAYVDAGLFERHINNTFWDEAFTIAKKHPIKHMLLTPIWMMRLNNPVHYTGANEIDQMFTGTHENIPDALKVVIILGIRALWYAFLALVIYTMYRFVSMWRTNPRRQYMSWIIFLILYFNIMHSVFIWTQVRYILPMMPFYLLLFVMSIYHYVRSRNLRVLPR